jgi:hypothetical protein
VPTSTTRELCSDAYCHSQNKLEGGEAIHLISASLCHHLAV